MSVIEPPRPSTPNSDSHMDAYPRGLPTSQPPFFYPVGPQGRSMYMPQPQYSSFNPFYFPNPETYADPRYDSRMFPMPFMEAKPMDGTKLPYKDERIKEEDRDRDGEREKSSPSADPSSPKERHSPRDRSPCTDGRSSPLNETHEDERHSHEGDKTPERHEDNMDKQEEPYDFSKGKEMRERDRTSMTSPPIAERYRSASFSYTPLRYHLHSESNDSMSPPRYLPHYKEDDKWNKQPHPDPLTSLLQKYSGHPDVSSLPPLQFPGISKGNDHPRGPGHLPITPPKYPVSLSNISPSHASMSPRQPDSYPSPATPTRSRSLDCENLQNKADYYYCHLCSYVGNSKFHFNAHMNSHFEHACPHCDYTSRTEGRLKRHIKDFHSDEPPDSFAGNKTPKRESTSVEGPPNRPKIFKCRQCEFASENKVEFWEHSRIHIKEDKVLQCPKCPFVTEYKHHLEYHLRNHFGSKPFKCGKCNYSCVNKSMLNSHMKSHTNVYQYRCSDCTYATKYCHSLKLHLKKYNHKPATVLNPDGSLPTDGSGDFELVSKRGPPRGPRGTKREKSPSVSFPSPSIMMPSQANIAAAAVAAAAAAAVGTVTSASSSAAPPLMPPHPTCWPPALMASSPGSLHGPPPPLVPSSSIPTGNPLSIQVAPEEATREPQNLSTKPMPALQPDGSLNLSLSASSPSSPKPTTDINSNDQLHCKVCEFKAETQVTMVQHMLRVHGAENQDLFNMFGMRAEAMLNEESGSEAIKDALSKSVGDQKETDDEDAFKCRTNKKHFNKILAEDMLANIQAEAKHAGIPVDVKQEMDGGEEHNEQEQEHQDQPDCITPKRRLSSDDFSEDQMTSSGDGPSPRKRSRKGKAYKLDMISIRLQERFTGSPPPENGEEDSEGSDESSDETKIHEEQGEKTREAQNQDENFKPENAAQSQRMMHVIRCLESEYGNEKQKYSGMSSPRSNSSPRPLEDLGNIPPPTMNSNNEYECTHCNIAFGDCIMYTVHMGYHGFSNPFKCNMCGHVAKDKVAFFLHIARAPHD